MRITGLIIGILALLPLRAGADSAALGLALDALRAGDRGLVAEAVGAMDDPVARDVIAWHDLRARRGDAAEYVDFLARNGDWPGLPLLRARGERAIAGADAATIIAYFEPQAPRNGTGVLALARALQATGDRAGAEAEAIRGYTELTLSLDSAAGLRTAFPDLLNGGTHHEDRLDSLLWDGEESEARAMIPYVPAHWPALAAARLALRARAPGVDGLIEAVPSSLRDDPGLAYERFVWRMRAGFWDTAGALMAERSSSADALGRPSAWADRRADLARDVAREGDFDTCYTYAANHHVTPETDYLAVADLEWIAGYCAYRLGRAEDALRHFRAFREVVFSPISVGRAGYWIGRAADAAGDAEAAAEGYALGARHQSSFYGQLAAERGGLPTDPGFLGEEDYGDWRQGSFTRSTVFHAALLLYEAGERTLAERFLTHLTESLSRAEAGQLGDFALEIGDPHIALMIAKRAAQSGHEIMRAYYPVTDLALAPMDISPALALSIARRESEFDPGVISPAGAIGLMQVMPGTGRDTARALGIAYDQDRLLADGDYNARLGTAYLAQLMARYDDNLTLVSAGYNAGPGRADSWIERFGDPRRAEDIVYWIEAIPFSETRNYIMRVTESIPIYEAQLTGTLPEPELAARIAR